MQIPLLEDWNPTPNTSYPMDLLPIEIQNLYKDIEEIKENYLLILEEKEKSITVPEILHHYTNVTGLKGIGFEKVIWFNDYRMTNDPTEGIYAEELIHRVFEQSLSTPLHTYELDAQGKLFVDSITDRQFIACFTENSDHLSQWVHYADSGSGYCIGIDTDHILSQDILIEEKSIKIKIFPIIYDRQQQEKEIGEFVQYVIQLEDNYSSCIDMNPNFLQYLQGCIFDLENWFVRLNALKYKNKHFEDEKEWRCLITSPMFPFTFIPSIRISGTSLVGYIPVDIMVRTLKSGPKTNYSHLHYAVGTRQFSENPPTKQVQLSHSDIPYR